MSSVIFNQAYNEWQGTAANEMDLIDPNLSFANTVDSLILNSIRNLITKVIEIFEKQKNLIEFSTDIQDKLNEELDKILPNILPDSILYYNFTISKSHLNMLFFDQFDLIYNTFERNLNSFMQLNQIDQINKFDEIWKNFINNISNIYINIADTFWEDDNKICSSAKLRQKKIRAAKARMFSEAKKIQEMEKNIIYKESIPKPTSTQVNHYRSEQIKYYRSIGGIPGLQYVSGKIFIIKLKLIL